MTLWTDPSTRRAPFGIAPKGLPHLEAVERLKDLARQRFDLAPGDPVIVSESECLVPGGPPMQTVVAFWTGDNVRHRFRVFKPVLEIDDDDVPPAWLKTTLATNDEIECACC